MFLLALPLFLLTEKIALPFSVPPRRYGCLSAYKSGGTLLLLLLCPVLRLPYPYDKVFYQYPLGWKAFPPMPVDCPGSYSYAVPVPPAWFRIHPGKRNRFLTPVPSVPVPAHARLLLPPYICLTRSVHAYNLPLSSRITSAVHEISPHFPLRNSSLLHRTRRKEALLQT